MSRHLPLSPLSRSSHMIRTASLRPTSFSRPSFAGSFRQASSKAASPVRRFVSTTLLLSGSALLIAYYYDSRSLLHEHVVMPVVRLVADAEEGHRLAIRVLGLSSWARPRDMGVDGPELEAELFGMKLNNPVGIAAGFDKDGEAIDGLFDLGFGYVEIGSVTPQPQPGNPKPRFFRLTEDQAAINRYGFNSLGHAQTLARLRTRLLYFSQSHPSLFPSPLSTNPLPPKSLPRSLREGHILAVNLGKNKTSPADSNDDYINGVKVLGPYADVVVINVSSPNTPGLRALQGREVLEKLLKDVVEERDRIAGGSGLPKIAVKVASDLSEDELGDVATAVRRSGVEGIIVSNTTVQREGLGLKSANQSQVGGLSGKPLFPYALHALRTLRPLLPPSIPLIGCGGISTGEDALRMAAAGASIVQVYTTFGYRGVGTPRLIKDEITSVLSKSSTTWKTTIGKDWTRNGKSVMGWDEERVIKEGEKLKQEAESLGELLRSLKEKEGISALIKEAENALGLGSRDNGLGSSGTPEANTSAGEPAPSISEPTKVPAVETSASTQGLITALVPTSDSNDDPAHTDRAHEVVQSITGQEAGADISAVIVVDNAAALTTPPPVPETDDTWVQEVRSGQKRLV